MTRDAWALPMPRRLPLLVTPMGASPVSTARLSVPPTLRAGGRGGSSGQHHHLGHETRGGVIWPAAVDHDLSVRQPT